MSTTARAFQLAYEAHVINAQLQIHRAAAMALVDSCDADECREVFRRVAANELPHGGFLTRFAEAFTSADLENFYVLLPSAYLLAAKYGIVEEHRQTIDETIMDFPPSA